jgi:hypothetical protein
VKRIGDAGFLHHLTISSHYQGRSFTNCVSRVVRRLPDLSADAALYQRNLHCPSLQDLAFRLGVTAQSLTSLGIGWCSKKRAWSFPMLDAKGQVIGIRLRAASGQKFAISGSRQGLFYSRAALADGRWIITEGPTDCAAAIDLGFPSVGLPSAGAAIPMLTRLVSIYRPQSVITVADNDSTGLHGMLATAAALRLHVRDVRLVRPPERIKDLREWRQRGLTIEGLSIAIDIAIPTPLNFQKGRQCP